MIQGPNWDNSQEYPAIKSKEFDHDMQSVLHAITQIEELSKTISIQLKNIEKIATEKSKEIIKTAQEIYKIYDMANKLAMNLSTFTQCILSVNGKDEQAKQMMVKCQGLYAHLAQAYKPLALFLILAPDNMIEEYLKNEKTKEQKFQIEHERKTKETLLSLEEETLITSLAIDGHTAWDNLYNNIASLIECDVHLPTGREKMGVAKATALLQDSDSKVRSAAYQAIQEGWEKNVEVCAQSLNSLAGWRHTICKKRSTQIPQNFLSSPLHENRMTAETLDTLFSVIHEGKELGQKALRLKAKAAGLKQLHPSDLFAPPPKFAEAETQSKFTFAEGLQIVIDAFSDVDPKMGEFAEMMHKNKWIEGSVGDNKRPGAYCTTFEKSATPRVYMTYMGGLGDISTLAHELGHAFHSWVMRDLPQVQTAYPMNLAETASLFAETVVSNALMKKAKSKEEQFPIAFNDAENAATFLLNIPARFRFEKEFYEMRLNQNLSVDDFKQLMDKSWRFYYGDTLSEMNTLFWASKLHFYISDLSFYNFPYSFGYLFSLGVYAQREKLGKDFYKNYINLLRDTGRMTAEDLVKTHLNEDIKKPEFWRGSLKIIEKQIIHLEKILN
ncbi:M3 family oligoendopeptidase [Fluviispira vulneris]|uniref:M3 family oligoendopeptidase n=1 Tax=Fluviispira vulneris TaxID=2763012 RepID=UPI0016476B78|nr:M3 family oligoendopeptidase [Fluviispira vulneris]